jgi:hypothetical protein
MEKLENQELTSLAEMVCPNDRLCLPQSRKEIWGKMRYVGQVFGKITMKW